MAAVTLWLAVSLLASKLSAAYVLYQQDLTQSYFPIVTQEVNPYAIAQHNDIVKKFYQLFSCPVCCEGEDTTEENEEDLSGVKEVVYSPFEEELTVLNVVPLKTTERSALMEDAQELNRNNEIIKEFLGETRTVKKENPEGVSKTTNDTVTDDA